MPATGSLQEQGGHGEYPQQPEQQQQQQHHQRLDEQQCSNSEPQTLPQTQQQQNQRSRSRPQHQSPRRPPSSTHLAVPSASAARSSSPSSSFSFVATPSATPSPSASVLSIDVSHSSREASPPIQTPSSSSAEAHNGRALRQFDTTDDREDSFDRDSEDYGRERYNPANMASWSGTPSIKGNTEAVRMVLLNFITIGVTFTWGVEMTC
ncbi:hypothetical protein NW757_002465 [Fusarium falciforme]|nr:hypothetical protein NW757_002465 [Fusarium falciforme]